MKKSLYLTAALLLGAALTSCQEDYENVSDNNRLYSTAEASVTNTVLDGKVNEITKPMTVRLAMPVATETVVEIGVDENGVTDYNQLYNQQAVMLPEEFWSLDGTTATIAANSVESTPVNVTFKDLLNLSTDEVHVLPITVTNSPVTLLEGKVTWYYVFRAGALINVVGGINKTCLTFVNEGSTPELGNLNKFTFEALLYPNAFGRLISTLMGIEGGSLIRIGDAGVPDNQIQFAKSQNATDPAWQLEIGKWQFVTITFDGDTGDVNVYFNGVKKGNTQRSGRGAINWNVKSADRACYIGYSYDTDRFFDGRIAEVRVWNKVLTPADLAARNHFYRVEPDAEGLCLYLKFDEGAGNVAHDSANGYDMQVPATYPGKSSQPGDLQWYEVSLP